MYMCMMQVTYKQIQLFYQLLDVLFTFEILLLKKVYVFQVGAYWWGGFFLTFMLASFNVFEFFKLWLKPF